MSLATSWHACTPAPDSTAGLTCLPPLHNSELSGLGEQDAGVACHHEVVDETNVGEGQGRWLLLSIDRLQGSELVMTQGLIANMLGVRQEGVTEAALKLQTAGLIQYARGHITVIDRPGLEQRTCEYYAVVKQEYDRLLPDLMAV